MRSIDHIGNSDGVIVSVAQTKLRINPDLGYGYQSTAITVGSPQFEPVVEQEEVTVQVEQNPIVDVPK